MCLDPFESIWETGERCTQMLMSVTATCVRLVVSLSLALQLRITVANYRKSFVVSNRLYRLINRQHCVLWAIRRLLRVCLSLRIKAARWTWALDTWASEKPGATLPILSIFLFRLIYGHTLSPPLSPFLPFDSFYEYALCKRVIKLPIRSCAINREKIRKKNYYFSFRFRRERISRTIHDEWYQQFKAISTMIVEQSDFN